MRGLYVQGVVIPDAIPFDGDLYEANYYDIGVYLSMGEYPKTEGLKMADFRREFRTLQFHQLGNNLNQSSIQVLRPYP